MGLISDRQERVRQGDPQYGLPLDGPHGLDHRRARRDEQAVTIENLLGQKSLACKAAIETDLELQVLKAVGMFPLIIGMIDLNGANNTW